MRPDWVPAGAWAALKIGSRVLTNWTAMAFIAVSVCVISGAVYFVMHTLTKTFGLNRNIKLA